MKKENVIDFNIYRKECESPPPPHEKIECSMSEELKTAIKNLIQQLRELGPIQSS